MTRPTLRCGAETTVGIQSQLPQRTVCYEMAGHPRRHRGNVLDSDDNWIAYTWSVDEPQPRGGAA